ncbi:Metallo-dependent phosphatase [Neolentinus lepideus HHB14362 ss-1]|uniref:Metallo-dependent phosphatase n=1 Tax=Neolentinus lepideus HHB14362 ss-1 TaxID=1314782 RepID=A0A165VJT2_9AGAM|nr:Metallo-dependent phosphatase [Neolentinus lepideus HHB14362 ss-1]
MRCSSLHGAVSYLSSPIMDVPRRLAAFLILSCFLLYFLVHGSMTASLGEWMHRDDDVEIQRDFSKYVHVKTILADEIGLEDPNRRIIIVGDIHGMNDSLHSLLSSIFYNPTTDTLFHTGDVVQKGPVSGSLSVLDFLSSSHIRGVRGNHDQNIIEWRTWMEWIKSLKGGLEWLDWVNRKFDKGELDDEEERNMKKRRGKWWSRVPKGWRMFDDHYTIARQMTGQHYQYLLSLPLVLHIPSQHLYIAHGGLLPYDPKRSVDHPKQPLANLPRIITRTAGSVNAVELDEESMRTAQEVDLLKKIPQNSDPWVILNIRSVTRSGKISRDTDVGTPWAKMWNKTVKKCSGFEGAIKKGEKHDGLPCLPATVVYGHTASRGLDVHRWTVGLDSGCSHGDTLTALVVSGKDLASNSWKSRSLSEQTSLSMGFLPAGGGDQPFSVLEDADSADVAKRPKKIPFSDNGFGHLYSVKCHQP